MCLGLPIKYTIKMKSKVVELFSLSKNDFIGLTINFKQYIESFLNSALRMYKVFKINYFRTIEEHKEMEQASKRKLIKRFQSKSKFFHSKFQEDMIKRNSQVDNTDTKDSMKSYSISNKETEIEKKRNSVTNKKSLLNKEPMKKRKFFSSKNIGCFEQKRQEFELIMEITKVTVLSHYGIHLIKQKKVNWKLIKK